MTSDAVERLDVRGPHAKAVARAAACLRAGGVVAYPTDTLYALGAAADDPRGVAALLALKGRPGDKAVPVIAADLAQVEASVGLLPPLGLTLAHRFWPGPLTLVVTAHPSLAPGVAADDGSVGVRVPAHPVARALAAAMGAPVTSTSANRSGGAPARSGAEAARLFAWGLALVLDAGPLSEARPSTIVDVRERTPRLLRAGAVPWEHVLESLQ